LKLELLHLCDSLFPIGAFAYSDGLEAATAAPSQLPGSPLAVATQLPGNGEAIPRQFPDNAQTTPRQFPGNSQGTPRQWAGNGGAGNGERMQAGGLREWIEVVLDESIGRFEGPAVWQAWTAVADRDWPALASLDEELTALRPASASRTASRAMGHRLLTTWSALHPDNRLARVPAPCSLPIAFAAACACSGVGQRETVDAYAYTRLAATVSAAMRLLPLGQTGAHALLARALEDVPHVVDGIAARGGRIESFAPALDIAAMTQQYLHSRLFRS
jgi:urease accessory protein